MARKKRVAILISGRGSNMQALIDASEKPDFPAEIVLVISNRPGAGGLNKATVAGIPQHVVDHKAFETKEDFEAALDDALATANVDIVCLAGFMRILSDTFVNKWRFKILNIHPSILPAFKGVNVHERMITAGVKIAGCTVHFVTSELDDGPIIGQAATAVDQKDDAKSLSEKILALEHKLYPECLKRVANGDARLSGNKVALKDSKNTGASIINPVD